MNMQTAAKVAETLAVRHYGEPVLREKSMPVTEITAELQEFACRMIESMFDEDGVGLAAPQVGYNIRLITLATNQPNSDIPADATPGERMLWRRMPIALINPEVVWASAEKQSAEEGCLSLPGIYGSVERPAKIMIRGRLLTGEMLQVECGGLLARCLQHEIDHLDGVLFVDRLNAEEKDALQPDLKKLEKATKRALKRGTS